MSKPNLHRYEWDFGAVPDDELTACCWWEYARESKTLRQMRHELLVAYPRGKAIRPTTGWIHGVGKFAAHHDASLLVIFLTDIPARRGDAAMGFPTPWIKLPKNKRQSWADVFRFQREDAVITRCDEFTPNDLLEEWQLFSGRKLAKRLAPGAMPNSILYPWGGELILIEVPWGEFTNEALVRSFRRWVKKNRPKQIAGPDFRGRGVKSARANLVRLGAMRLLARFTAADIVFTSRNRCPEVWESAQFKRSKWQDPTKWYDARRMARQYFHSLFPGLPKDEPPISFSRRSNVWVQPPAK